MKGRYFIGVIFLCFVVHAMEHKDQEPEMQTAEELGYHPGVKLITRNYLRAKLFHDFIHDSKIEPVDFQTSSCGTMVSAYYADTTMMSYIIMHLRNFFCPFGYHDGHKHKLIAYDDTTKDSMLLALLPIKEKPDK